MSSGHSQLGERRAMDGAAGPLLQGWIETYSLDLTPLTLVEPGGIEPPTSTLPVLRSPS